MSRSRCSVSCRFEGDWSLHGNALASDPSLIKGTAMAKAMILAAGQGTRVRPLTKYMPKPMIPILGKPVLEYLIEHLARYGVKEIMINVAYSHWKIESYFVNGSGCGGEIGHWFECNRDHREICPKPTRAA